MGLVDGNIFTTDTDTTSVILRVGSACNDHGDIDLNITGFMYCEGNRTVDAFNAGGTSNYLGDVTPTSKARRGDGAWNGIPNGWLRPRARSS